MKYTATRFLFILAILASTGCATLDSRTREQVIAERAQTYVGYLAKKDFAHAYPFTSAGYRSGVSEQEFARRWMVRPVQWKAANVQDVHCIDTVCTVIVKVDYEVQIPSAYVGDYRGKRNIKMKWFQSDDKLWYYSPTR